MPELYIVTGASAGLGLHAALSLAAGGGTLVLTGRDAARLEAAAERARAAGAAADTTGVPLDLADLGSVSRFADDLEQRFPGRSIAALVLNAGINTPRFAWSADGIEATFATNHLGHFLLAQLLLPRMAPRGRVVITSSGTHDPAVKAPLPEPKWDELGEMAMLKWVARGRGRSPRRASSCAWPQRHSEVGARRRQRAAVVTPRHAPLHAPLPFPTPPPREDLGGVPPPNYDGGLAYTRSKLCNIYMAYELARRLAAAGSRVTVTAYDPVRRRPRGPGGWG